MLLCSLPLINVLLWPSLGDVTSGNSLLTTRGIPPTHGAFLFRIYTFSKYIVRISKIGMNGLTFTSRLWWNEFISQRNSRLTYVQVQTLPHVIQEKSTEIISDSVSATNPLGTLNLQTQAYRFSVHHFHWGNEYSPLPAIPLSLLQTPRSLLHDIFHCWKQDSSYFLY